MKLLALHGSKIALLTVVVAATACNEGPPVAPTKVVAPASQMAAAPRYIVELIGAGSVPPSVASLVQSHGGRILGFHAGTGLVVVGGISREAAIEVAMAPGVRAVAPDLTMRMIRDPTMRLFSGRLVADSKVLTAVGARGNPRTAQFYSHQWNMTRIHADSAWQVSTQGAGVKVFILDTGIDTAHVDLAGLVDTKHSTSFAYAPTDTLFQNPLPFSHDVVGHGSFVSSIIASNSLGIAAVAPQAKLTMVRVLDDSGMGSSVGLLQGILYATDSGANIINMSLGGYLGRKGGSDLAFADIYQRVIDYATQRGVLLVAAAGNESVNTNTGTSPSGSYADSMDTPAGLHHVLSVGATGPVDQVNFDQIAKYSNFGKAGVGVFAPGGNTVDQTTTGQADLVLGVCSSAMPLCPGTEIQYLIGAGTSFSSPHVAGEAAVVRGQRGATMTVTNLENCILQSADNVSKHRPDVNYNFGRIDVLSGLVNSHCK